MGDPWGTIASLLYTIKRCQIRVDEIRPYCHQELKADPDNPSNSISGVPLDPDYEWKAFALLLVSYDENGVEKADEFLTKTL
jgi:hypothetical protein